ncbi:MAG: branched-chain-amino-acid transaminase [Deltaproteobacteria bacterium]|nr:branched-chain-amino-acid transaminase [Deltaproteobacteria bacterium]
MAKVSKVPKIWLDGKFIPWDDANIHILTHTLHYGLGVFEGIRAYKGANGKTAIFRLKDHIDRLYDSAKISLITIPYKKEEIVEACKELFRVNKLAEGYLRPIVFIGDGEMGLYAIDNPIRIALVAWPWGTYLGEEGVKNGIRAKISSYTRLTVNTMMTKSKTCGNYINSILAKREALKGGYEEAIMLDHEGYVSEATGENIFVVRDGIARTPSAGSSILKGITRDCVIRILEDNKIPVQEGRITRDSAYVADEIFLSGTAAEITPIRELDDRTIGSGKPGPITQKVQQAYFDIIRGKVKKYEEWLDYV